MSAFVLVHGSGQSAACWARVASVLSARGHEVVTPDLPKQAADWRLEQHAEVIARAIPAEDTVVVAHSFSGAFLPLVPQQRACAQLVYFAAVLPAPGQSVREQFAADPTMFCPGWIEAGARWFDPTQVEDLAREYLFHDCDDDTIGWALRTLAMMDTRPLVTQPCPLTAWPEVPAHCIVASGDRTLSPDWCRRRSREVLGREPIEIEAGHCPQVSRPDAVAAILERIATT